MTAHLEVGGREHIATGVGRDIPFCPSCGVQTPPPFYCVPQVPVQSVLLMSTRQEALGIPRGQISLSLCQACGFIYNQAFEPDALEYSPRYEETQAFSPAFKTFERALAGRLIERYGLRGKHIVEIGCGKGDFIALLCEMGHNYGTGLDPSYVAERRPSTATDRVRYLPEFFSERHASLEADFICCKMTLEHISQVSSFVQMIRQTIGTRRRTLTFLQVPNVTRILREVAFWDIYYEHCSYFAASSLTRLLHQCHFEVVDLEEDYDGQYLLVVGRPSARRRLAAVGAGAANDLVRDVARFAAAATKTVEEWRKYLSQLRTAGRRVALWGGGSKAVAFLTTLGLGPEVQYVVDVNPYRQDTFLPGTGHQIVSPGVLTQSRPDVVIVMNAVYREEIRQQLHHLGLDPKLVIVGEAQFSDV